MTGHSRMEGNKCPVYIQSTNELNQQWQAIQGWKATSVQSISSLPMNSINNDRPFKDGRQQVSSLYPVYQWTQSTRTGHSRMEGNKCPVYIQSTNELNQQWQTIQGWKATSVQSISSLPMNSINNDRPFKDGRQQVSSLYPVYQWTQSTMTGHSRMEGNKCPVYIKSTSELKSTMTGHSRMEGNKCPVYIQSTMNSINNDRPFKDGRQQVSSLYQVYQWTQINNDRPFKDGRQQVSSLYPVYQWTQSTMTGHSRMEGNKCPVYIKSTNELKSTMTGHSRMEGNKCPVYIQSTMNSINNDRPFKDGRQHVASLYPVYNELNQQWQAIQGWKATSVQSISSLPMNSINNDRPFKDGRQQVSSLYPVYQWTQSTMTGHSRMEGNKCPVYIQSTNELNQQGQAIQGWKATSVQSISSLPMNSINNDRPFKDGRQQVSSLYRVYQWTQSTMTGHSRMEGNKCPVYIQSTNELNQQGQAIQGWKATRVQSISSLPMNSINNDRPFKDGRQQVSSLYQVYKQFELNQQWQAIQGWKATSVQSISSLPMNSINNDRPFKDGRQQVSSLYPVYQWTQSTMTGHSRMEGNKCPVYIQSTMNSINNDRPFKDGRQQVSSLYPVYQWTQSTMTGHSSMEGNMCPVYIQSTNELNQQWQAIQGWKATSVQSISSLPMNSINNDRPFKDGRQQVSSLYPVYQWTQSTRTGHSRMEGNKCPVYIQSTNELNQQWQAIQGWKATSVQSISSLQWQAIQGWKATSVQSISSLHAVWSFRNR